MSIIQAFTLVKLQAAYFITASRRLLPPLEGAAERSVKTGYPSTGFNLKSLRYHDTVAVHHVSKETTISDGAASFAISFNWKQLKLRRNQ